jgi:hypothetical protein
MPSAGQTKTPLGILCNGVFCCPEKRSLTSRKVQFSRSQWRPREAGVVCPVPRADHSRLEIHRCESRCTDSCGCGVKVAQRREQLPRRVGRSCASPRPAALVHLDNCSTRCPTSSHPCESPAHRSSSLVARTRWTACSLAAKRRAYTPGAPD